MTNDVTGLRRRPSRRRWAMTAGAVAVLAATQLTVQTVTAGVAGAASVQVIASNVVASNSAETASATATCPEGLRVLGGGGYVTASGQVLLTGLVPASVAGVDSFTATGTEQAAGFDQDWAVQAFAVCGVLDRVRIVSTTTVLPMGAGIKRAEAVCPFGWSPLGAGGEIQGNGRVSFKLITAMTVAPPRVVVDGMDDLLDGYEPAQLFGVTAYAICSPRSMVVSVAWDFDASGEEEQAVEGSCPDPKRVHGVGMSNVDPDGHAHLIALLPALTASGGTAKTKPPTAPPAGHTRDLELLLGCA